MLLLKEMIQIMQKLIEKGIFRCTSRGWLKLITSAGTLDSNMEFEKETEIRGLSCKDWRQYSSLPSGFEDNAVFHESILDTH